MSEVYIADTGVFIRCGGPDNQKFQRLRRALQEAGTSLYIPQRVYEELGGDPAADAYPSGQIPYPDGFVEGSIVVADELNYANSTVSTVMDQTRRFIPTETGRDEDIIEKADTALVGLAAEIIDTGQADNIVLLTTDKPAGRAAATLLPQHGFVDQIEYRYASVEFLETLATDEFE